MFILTQRMGMNLSILVIGVLYIVPEQVHFGGFCESSGELPLQQHHLTFSVFTHQLALWLVISFFYNQGKSPGRKICLQRDVPHYNTKKLESSGALCHNFFVERWILTVVPNLADFSCHISLPLARESPLLLRPRVLDLTHPDNRG